jgi:Rad3-related DNA helicase
MARGIEGVCNKYPNERILVHTVSYDLASYLYSELDLGSRPIYTYRDSFERQEALNNYKASNNSVILAPSMDRGIDLPDDLCRVQIVAKIPFPNIKDKRIAARLHGSIGGKSWYKMQTIRTLIQMCGRGMRSKDDWVHTYILDSQFLTNLWKSKFLFAKWWTDAINWRFNKRSIGL